jgi:hypothetical protein
VSAALPPQLLSDLLARPQDVAEIGFEPVPEFIERWVRIASQPQPYFRYLDSVRTWSQLALWPRERISEVLIRSTWLAANGKPLEARWVRLPDHRCADLGGGQWFGCEGAP